MTNSSNNYMEGDIGVHADLLIASGNYARDFQRRAREGAIAMDNHRGCMAFQQRPGRDVEIFPASDSTCVRCERRNCDYGHEPLCLSCDRAFDHDCPTELHQRIRQWSILRADRGANCPACNLFLPAPVGDDGPPSDSDRRARIRDLDLEVGIEVVAVLKSLATRVLPEEARATAAKLARRIGDSRTTIPAGDETPLYTALLVGELLLNQVTAASSGIVLDAQQMRFVDSARLAIRRISGALLAHA